MSDADAGRRSGKSASAFRTTSEVGEELNVPAHVLRFWESKFPQLRPLRRGGGRRYYRPEDIELVRRIRQCLYQEGYSIRGVQKLLRQGELRPDRPPAEPEPEGSPPMLFALDPVAPSGAAAPHPHASRQALQAALEEVRRELLEIRALLAQMERG